MILAKGKRLKHFLSSLLATVVPHYFSEALLMVCKKCHLIP